MNNGDKPANPISEETTDRIDNGINIYTGLTKREAIAMHLTAALLTATDDHGDWQGINADAGNQALIETDVLLAALEES